MFYRFLCACALAISVVCVADAASPQGQSQVDLRQEISALEARAAVASTTAQQLLAQLQPDARALEDPDPRGDDGRNPRPQSRDPYIQQCCRAAYDGLATGINRMSSDFETLKRGTFEYQQRPLVHAFNEGGSGMAAVVQALAGLAAATDRTSALRALEFQLLPSLQTLLPALEQLAWAVNSQLESAPFYFLRAGSQGAAFSNTVQAAPGEQVAFQVRLDAALAPGPVFPASPVSVWASVPHRWDNVVELQAPVTLSPGQQAQTVYVIQLTSGMADQDIPVTFRATGDFPRQHRGVQAAVTLRVRNPH